jgi:glycyl-tRNA synthetase (class II)
MTDTSMDDGCTCQSCGKTFRVDIIVPDYLWEKIKPEGKPKGGGLLCGSCIMERLESMGFGAFRLSEIWYDIKTKSE